MLSAGQERWRYGMAYRHIPFYFEHWMEVIFDQKRSVLNINNLHFGHLWRNLKAILLVFVRFTSISSLCTLPVFHTFTDCSTCWPWQNDWLENLEQISWTCRSFHWLFWIASHHFGYLELYCQSLCELCSKKILHKNIEPLRTVCQFKMYFCNTLNVPSISWTSLGIFRARL